MSAVITYFCLFFALQGGSFILVEPYLVNFSITQYFQFVYAVCIYSFFTWLIACIHNSFILKIILHIFCNFSLTEFFLCQEFCTCWASSQSFFSIVLYFEFVYTVCIYSCIHNSVIIKIFFHIFHTLFLSFLLSHLTNLSSHYGELFNINLTKSVQKIVHCNNFSFPSLIYFG